jgi:hypothetical protein
MRRPRDERIFGCQRLRKACRSKVKNGALYRVIIQEPSKIEEDFGVVAVPQLEKPWKRAVSIIFAIAFAIGMLAFLWYCATLPGAPVG